MKTITKSALMLFSIGVLTACGAQETPTTSGSEPVESEEPGTSVISSEPSSVEIDDYAYGKYVVTDFETERQVAYYDSDDATLRGRQAGSITTLRKAFMALSRPSRG